MPMVRLLMVMVLQQIEAAAVVVADTAAAVFADNDRTNWRRLKVVCQADETVAGADDASLTETVVTFGRNEMARSSKDTSCSA
jgi:hypothetical protein